MTKVLLRQQELKLRKEGKKNITSNTGKNNDESPLADTNPNTIPLAINPIKPKEPPPDKPPIANPNPPTTPMENSNKIPPATVNSQPWICHHWSEADRAHSSWPNEAAVCSGVSGGKEFVYKSADKVCECNCCERLKE
jgi:hypothetical protein